MFNYVLKTLNLYVFIGSKKREEDENMKKYIKFLVEI